MNDIRWKKAAASAEQTDCVELAHTLDGVRDSKNPEGPSLAVDLRRFVQAIKDGQLTH